VNLSLRRNLGLKIAALALALFVWFLVTSEEEVVRVGDVTIFYDFESNEQVLLTGTPPDQVPVRVWGPASVMSRMRMENLSFRVNLRATRPGNRTLSLSPERHLQNLPPGCQAQLVNPQPITLALEERTDLQVPVSAAVAGEPPEGYLVEKISVRPPNVWVMGPASAFSGPDVVRVITDAIDLSDLDANGTARTHVLRVGALPNDPRVRIQGFTEFTAIIEFQEKQGRMVRQVPLRGSPDPVEVQDEIATVRVALQGYPSLMEEFFQELQARVNSEALGRVWQSRPVTLSLEPAASLAELVSIEPAQVMVRAPLQEGAPLP
jgi:YbbR domain-containing protein